MVSAIARQVDGRKRGLAVELYRRQPNVGTPSDVVVRFAQSDGASCGPTIARRRIHARWGSSRSLAADHDELRLRRQERPTNSVASSGSHRSRRGHSLGVVLWPGVAGEGGGLCRLPHAAQPPRHEPVAHILVGIVQHADADVHVGVLLLFLRKELVAGVAARRDPASNPFCVEAPENNLYQGESRESFKVRLLVRTSWSRDEGREVRSMIEYGIVPARG
jgi:hypothetical protein